MTGERRGDGGGEEEERAPGVPGNRGHQLTHLSGHALHEVATESLWLVEEDSAHTLALVPLP